jgi:hypothetical protein
MYLLSLPCQSIWKWDAVKNDMFCRFSNWLGIGMPWYFVCVMPHSMPHHLGGNIPFFPINRTSLISIRLKERLGTSKSISSSELRSDSRRAKDYSSVLTCTDNCMLLLIIHFSTLFSTKMDYLTWGNCSVSSNFLKLIESIFLVFCSDSTQ